MDVTQRAREVDGIPGVAGHGGPSPRFAWVPLPVFLVLFVVLHSWAGSSSFEPRLLLPVLNLAFLTAMSFVVAWAAGATYLAFGSAPVLLVAFGGMAWGVGNLLASIAALIALRADFVAGVHNVAALVAGSCFAGSSILLARPELNFSWPRRRALLAGFAGVALPLVALATAKAFNWPHLPFFTADGPTLLRQSVLGASVALFAFAGLLAWVLLAGTGSRFVTWYALALLLTAVGLAGVFVTQRLGTPLGWAGRVAQYLGCAYLLAAVRCGPANSFPLVQLLWETRDRYRRLVELSPGAIFVHADGKYVFANPAGVALLGARSVEDVVGRDVLELVHPDFRGSIRERMEVARGGSTTPLREAKLLRLDGKAVDVETTAAPVEFLGRPAIQVVMRDITARKRAEDLAAEVTREAQARAAEAAEGKRILDEQAARLAEANRLKDEFLATLSHELRTPLNAILGWSHMLVRGMLEGDAARQAVDAIHRNAEAQVRLINDVLDVSRIVSGKLRLELRRVNIASCVESALAAVRPAALARQIEIVDDLGEGGIVLGDPDRLQQVFWNLLSNALKFTGMGGRVTVTLSRDGAELGVCVRDTGSGIAPEFLPHVFERFTQADGSTTRAHGGLGLGLAIVRHLVELHGGRVTAESAGVGQGAAFTVWVPTAAAATATEGAAWLERSEFGPRVDKEDGVSLAGVKVLVVDDEADTRDLLEAVLRSHGAAVAVAESAASALEVAVTWRPDVILSDIGMPGEDGYELIRRLRELPPESGGLTPAIAVTAYGRAQDRAKALAAGYLDHVAKPVVPSALVATVAMVLTGKGSLPERAHPGKG